MFPQEASRVRIDSSVSFLKSLFEKIGFETSIIKGNKTNPFVFAEYKVLSKAETVLIYGHYDVQPADRKDAMGIRSLSG